MSTPFDDFLIHTVDLYAYAPGQDADGGAATPWSPVPYATAEPCYAEPGDAGESWDQDRASMVLNWTVFFGRNPGIGLHDELRVDAAGNPHTLFVTGPVDMTQAALPGLCEVAAIERL